MTIDLGRQSQSQMPRMLFLVQEDIYYFLDTQVPVIEVTDAQMACKDLTVDIDYFF